MKLYILVDKRLPRDHKAVQAGHAIAAFLKANPNTEWTNGTLVYLRSEDIEFDAQFCDAVWKEPYWDDRLTAAACLGRDEMWVSHKLL